jgi:hypothetical protein
MSGHNDGYILAVGNFPVVICGCFGKTALITVILKLSVPKGGELRDEWRTLHEEKLCEFGLCSL